MAKSVLVVDDENLIAELVANLLEDICGVKALIASNGEVALTIFEDKQPDMLITDLKMPVRDGEWVSISGGSSHF